MKFHVKDDSRMEFIDERQKA